MITLYKKNCLYCNKTFKSIYKRRKFCNKSCNTSTNNKNRKWKQSSKDKIGIANSGTFGEKNPNWRGGGITIICRYCSTKFKFPRWEMKRGKKLGRKMGIFCNTKCHRKYLQKHKMPNYQHKINRSMKCAMRRCIHEKKAWRKWTNLVGYTSEELLNHLQSLFTDGMSFDNYGKWHIDHIIPVSAFNFKFFTDTDFKKCWSLNNLQPLWAKDNMSKGGINRKNYEKK